LLGSLRSAVLQLAVSLGPPLIESPLPDQKDAADHQSDDQRHEHVLHPPQWVLGEEAPPPALRWESARLRLPAGSAPLSGDATRTGAGLERW
jgi:hypothetical protein